MFFTIFNVIFYKQYYVCHLSSAAEQHFCKVWVLGSNPRGGSSSLWNIFIYDKIMELCQSSSVVERFLGKKEVVGPIPTFGSKIKLWESDAGLQIFQQKNRRRRGLRSVLRDGVKLNRKDSHLWLKNKIVGIGRRTEGYDGKIKKERHLRVLFCHSRGSGNPGPASAEGLKV